MGYKGKLSDKYITPGEEYEVIVIGAGHAGCEAALASARLGLKTLILTMSVDHVAFMPCNPHIGGSSKGHLVREIDALGGEMGKNIDKTFLQSKMLNTSKGPAVHSLRAQADKLAYSMEMRKVLEAQENLTIKQAEVTELLTDPTESMAGPDGQTQHVRGIRLASGLIYEAKVVILCTGTYGQSRCLCGESITETGPNGLQRSVALSDSLRAIGIGLRRFKTGTPARMDGSTVDYSRMSEQPGDVPVIPFSYSTDPATVQREQVPCYLTWTNEQTHEIIRQNLDRSPIYAGIIEGIGPRYCPSIEDKVVKFPDHERHQVFVEPEGAYTNEVYIDGMSSSMPEDVQVRMYRTVPGLEHARIVKNAYAIEYDCLIPGQLTPALEIRAVRGLYSAGQINGSSGYEEAAAQGLVAGVNAAMQILGREPLTIDRSEGYIGVLIDDLVTKENREPYRMMTSRAEYRLLLRQDNADLRLREKGYEVGLISEEQIRTLREKRTAIETEKERLNKIKLGASAEVQQFLESHGSSPLKTGVTMAELMNRQELSYEILAPLDKERKPLPPAVIEQVEIDLRYAGYIERQERQVQQYRKAEHRKIPSDLDYSQVKSLRLEARQKLNQFRPVSIGQASRIAGVTPADVSVLIVYLDSRGRRSDH
ncbi:MAG: tRNA uridine-5-carboxymethylaminomethyl(34) synthesis enzyme MnmG [Lachnospiraceae bacterium]|nr:tRNA uridine-5-carboxymethylaminomethyl(34) synthesis enzyme MnmG [Lachnospiraceae bacterium]